jgi:hypothetical protein
VGGARPAPPLGVDLTPARPTAREVEEPGLGRLETWEVEPAEAGLRALLTDLFQHHWRELTFGPLIQGSAWEIRAPRAPERIGFLDGYLTVDFGHFHFHLCIGEHRGAPEAPTPPELARHRRTSCAYFYRRLNADGTPDSWGLRLLTGRGEEQITLLFPNPFLTEDLRMEAEPRWERLALWDDLRRRYLGLAPDPRDRSGRRMLHG